MPWAIIHTRIIWAVSLWKGTKQAERRTNDAQSPRCHSGVPLVPKVLQAILMDKCTTLLGSRGKGEEGWYLFGFCASGFDICVWVAWLSIFSEKNGDWVTSIPTRFRERGVGWVDICLDYMFILVWCYVFDLHALTNIEKGGWLDDIWTLWSEGLAMGWVGICLDYVFVLSWNHVLEFMVKQISRLEGGGWNLDLPSPKGCGLIFAQNMCLFHFDAMCLICKVKQFFGKKGGG